jgi:hypothetical protein
MNTEVLETLRAARAQITERENWTQGCMARDRDGNVCSPHSADAYSFCAFGAIVVAVGGYDAAKSARERLWHKLSKMEERCLSIYNDSHTHEEVLALFDAAIARLEAT